MFYVLLETGKDNYFHMGVYKNEIDARFHYEYDVLASLYHKFYGDSCHREVFSDRDFRIWVCPKLRKYNFIPSRMDDDTFVERIEKHSHSLGVKCFYVSQKFHNFICNYDGKFKGMVKSIPANIRGKI